MLPLLESTCYKSSDTFIPNDARQRKRHSASSFLGEVLVEFAPL